MRVKDLPNYERPRERFLKYGVESLSNQELLAIILKTGNRNHSVNDLSLDILKVATSIENLKDITRKQLESIPGIGLAQALTVLSTIELGKRIFVSENDFDKIVLRTSQDIYDYMKYQLLDKKQEYFYCLYLNQKKELIERKLLFMGTVNRSIVHPREVFKYAYLYSASGIVCVHNHPSGDVKPSKEDFRITNSLVELGVVNGIPILDHIIVGDSGYYSFYTEGKIMNL